MAQKLLLVMLGQAGRGSLAEELHIPNAVRPFTVSDLFQNGPEHCWLRVTGLTPSLCEALHHLTIALPGSTLSLPPRDSADESAWAVHVEAAVMSQHEWAGQSTYAGLADAAWARPPGSRLTLDFMTPTVLKSVGVQRLFPEPPLIFRLLYERLLKTEGIPLPFQPAAAYLETFAEYFIEAADYQLTCVQVPLKRSRTAAFQGQITYQMLGGNDDAYKRARKRQSQDGDPQLMAMYEDIQQRRPEYMCLINLLAEFAFYSGVGRYTAQGMGMVRPVQGSGR